MQEKKKRPASRAASPPYTPFSFAASWHPSGTLHIHHLIHLSNLNCPLESIPDEVPSPRRCHPNSTARCEQETGWQRSCALRRPRQLSDPLQTPPKTLSSPALALLSLAQAPSFAGVTTGTTKLFCQDSRGCNAHKPSWSP